MRHTGSRLASAILLGVMVSIGSPSAETARAWQADSEPESATTTLENSSSAEPEDAGRGPAPEQQPPVVDDVRASSFQSVTPGETPATKLGELLGDPVDERVDGSEKILTYEIGPFPKVEVIIASEKVASIVVHLDQPSTPDEVAQELGLDDFLPAPVLSETGDRLGQTYPERGVTFSFVPGSEPRRVGQLVLAPISSETFMLRVNTDSRNRYQQNLADLEYAREIDPNNAEIHRLLAHILMQAGMHRQALVAADRAVSLNSQDGRFRVTRAAVLVELGEFERAVVDLETVLAAEKTPVVVRAQAECRIGNLRASAVQPDYQAAIQHRLAAIELATPAGTDPRVAVRRLAKRVLIDAHLAVASDIARGNWQNKQQTMEKWLRNASELANATIDHDGGAAELRLIVLRRALTAYAGLAAHADAENAVNKVIEETDRLLSDAEDPLYKHRVRWLAVGALHDAMKIERTRGAGEQILKYAEQAHQILKQMSSVHEATPRAEYLTGQIYFDAGLIHAVQRQDHEQAVVWYERALPYFSGELPASELPQQGRHGERFVSMGVSYWKTQVREEAVALTQRGLEFMQQAQRDGYLKKQAMVVPYGNLASMYKAMNKTEEARRMAAKAAQLKRAGQDADRR